MFADQLLLDLAVPTRGKHRGKRQTRRRPLRKTLREKHGAIDESVEVRRDTPLAPELLETIGGKRVDREQHDGRALRHRVGHRKIAPPALCERTRIELEAVAVLVELVARHVGRARIATRVAWSAVAVAQDRDVAVVIAVEDGSKRAVRNAAGEARVLGGA